MVLQMIVLLGLLIALIFCLSNIFLVHCRPRRPKSLGSCCYVLKTRKSDNLHDVLLSAQFITYTATLLIFTSSLLMLISKIRRVDDLRKGIKIYFALRNEKTLKALNEALSFANLPPNYLPEIEETEFTLLLGRVMTIGLRYMGDRSNRKLLYSFSDLTYEQEAADDILKTMITLTERCEKIVKRLGTKENILDTSLRELIGTVSPIPIIILEMCLYWFEEGLFSYIIIAFAILSSLAFINQTKLTLILLASKSPRYSKRFNYVSKCCSEASKVRPSTIYYTLQSLCTACLVSSLLTTGVLTFILMGSLKPDPQPGVDMSSQDFAPDTSYSTVFLLFSSNLLNERKPDEISIINYVNDFDGQNDALINFLSQKIETELMFLRENNMRINVRRVNNDPIKALQAVEQFKLPKYFPADVSFVPFQPPGIQNGLENLNLETLWKMAKEMLEAIPRDYVSEFEMVIRTIFRRLNKDVKSKLDNIGYDAQGVIKYQFDELKFIREIH